MAARVIDGGASITNEFAAVIGADVFAPGTGSDATEMPEVIAARSA
jgi:hypothetical protein